MPGRDFLIFAQFHPTERSAKMSEAAKFFDLMASQPVTTVTVGIVIGVWALIQRYEGLAKTLAFNLNAIVSEKELWRFVTSCFAHQSILHLMFNVISLISLPCESMVRPLLSLAPSSVTHRLHRSARLRFRGQCCSCSSCHKFITCWPVTSFRRLGAGGFVLREKRGLWDTLAFCSGC